MGDELGVEDDGAAVVAVVVVGEVFGEVFSVFRAEELVEDVDVGALG